MLLSLVACATKPTPYQKEHNKQGYRDIMEDGLRISSFKGNSVTKKDYATSFAEFRAIDQCRNENLHANILDVVDKTIKKDVTRSSGTGFGPTWGMYPYYGRYSSIGIGGTFGGMSGQSWQETLIFPQIEVYYTCSEKIQRPKMVFKEISDEQMKLLVKDLKGALQIIKIEEDAPSKNDFEHGDIILKADNQRIEKVYELHRLITPNRKELTVAIMREGQKMEKTLKTSDVTENVIKAEDDIIGKICQMKKEEKQKDLLKSKACGG